MNEQAQLEHYRPAPLIRRSASRQLLEIFEQRQISDAIIEAREHNAAFRVAQRVDNGYQLAAQTVQNAAQLNHIVTQVCLDNPGLEMTLRGIEQTVSLGAQAIIHGYMTRP